jgi:hypothetical protein
MPETGPSDDGTSDQGVGPIDPEILDRIEGYLVGSDRFSTVRFRPAQAPNSVVAEYDLGYFPPRVARAYLEIRWYETDDFTVHYSEKYSDGDRWECRWDRHPNEHNTRDHFHPPPAAKTPGDDEDFPQDWREVMSLVVNDLDARVKSFWE